MKEELWYYRFILIIKFYFFVALLGFVCMYIIFVFVLKKNYYYIISILYIKMYYLFKIRMEL